MKNPPPELCQFHPKVELPTKRTSPCRPVVSMTTRTGLRCACTSLVTSCTKMDPLHGFMKEVSATYCDDRITHNHKMADL